MSGDYDWDYTNVQIHEDNNIPTLHTYRQENSTRKSLKTEIGLFHNWVNAAQTTHTSSHHKPYFPNTTCEQARGNETKTPKV